MSSSFWDLKSIIRIHVNFYLELYLRLYLVVYYCVFAVVHLYKIWINLYSSTPKRSAYIQALPKITASQLSDLCQLFFKNHFTILIWNPHRSKDLSWTISIQSIWFYRIFFHCHGHTFFDIKPYMYLYFLGPYGGRKRELFLYRVSRIISYS